MTGSRSQRITLVFGALLFLFSSTHVFGQLDDPDPNSPTPVLLSQDASVRALAAPAGQASRKGLSSLRYSVFEPGSAVELFVRNLRLMDGEGANAFRVYAEDSAGHKFRFPVVGLRLSGPDRSTYGLKVTLTDEIGYWDSPVRGDLAIYVTWRGLASNKVLFGYGGTGGGVKIDEGSRPDSGNLGPRAAGPASPEYIGYRWSGDRARFLQQAAFGLSPDLDGRIRRIGLRTWLAEQMDAAYPSAANPYPNIPLRDTDPNNATNGCGAAPNPTTPEYRICIRDHYSMYPIQTWHFREAFYGEPQLRHRVAWALSQMWVISGVDTQQSSWMIAYHKILSQHAFGNYRQLMKDMTLNPGMGNYLDMVRSTRNNPNENYPREVLQLFAVGLFMLNPDGTLQLDGQGDPVPTYDQNTINNFTRVFTGWTFCNTTCPNSLPGLINYKDPMILTQANHDVTAKTLFSYPGAPNTNIPANTNGATELDMALDNIFNHPNVGPFVSRQLIQHLVTSDPTPAYVGRVAAVFNNNGLGVRGDLKSVVRAILLDPEARGDIKTDPNYGKLREPVEMITDLGRAFNVRSFNGQLPSDGAVQNLANNMGQNPFNSPTVFNYFPPDYVIPGTAINGPEFALMTTGTSISRANFANTMVMGTGVGVGENSPNGTSIDLTELTNASAADTTGNQLLDLLNWRLLHGRMSAAMRAKILPAVTVIPTDHTARARAALYLVVTSSQFQIQR